MKKFFVLFVICVLANSAYAGILSSIPQNVYNGYQNRYYNRPMRYDYNHYDYNHYHNRRYTPYNYRNNYRQPVIYKNNVRYKSENNYNKYVSEKVDLKKLEKKIFNQSFEYDTQQNRIERLERKIFGACQTGTAEERLMLLQHASQNYKAYNNNSGYNSQNQYRPPIFTGSTGSSWRNLLMGNFMNQFAGTATGFTPTLTPGMDPAYMDYFEAERELSGAGESYGYSDNHRSIYSNTMRVDQML